MIEAWLDLPAAGVFVVLIALYAATGAAIAWLVFGAAFRASVRRLDGVVPPFFGAVAILFALLTGFLAGDVGDRNRQAARAVQAEAGELRNVLTLSVAAPSDMRDIRATWTRYVKAIITDDWPAMERGAQAASASTAYDLLLREVIDPRSPTRRTWRCTQRCSTQRCAPAPRARTGSRSPPTARTISNGWWC